MASFTEALVVKSAPFSSLSNRDPRSAVPAIAKWIPGVSKINDVDKDGFAQIHYAARLNNLTVLGELLAAKADVNQLSKKDHSTALHFAAAHSTTPGPTESTATAVRMILSAHEKYGGEKVDIKIGNLQKNTALHIACSRGNLLVVKDLIQYDARCLNLVDLQGDTPLHEACLNGHFEIVKHLLCSGANINALNTDKELPLHLACKGGHTRIVGHLIKPEFGMAARTFNVPDAEGSTPLLLAVESGVYDLVKVLLFNGADPLVPNRNGSYPIHIAAESKDLRSVLSLLEASSEQMELQGRGGRAPLHYAALNNQGDMVAALLQRGANKEALDEDSSTPLILAAARGKANAVKVLLQGGAEVNTTDKDGKSAVYWAAQEGHVDVLKILLGSKDGAGLACQAEFSRQNTPLHAVAERGQVEAFQILLFAIRNASLDDGDGQGEADSQEEFTESVIEREIRKGVRERVYARNDGDQTPLHLAALGGHLEIVNLLVNCRQDTLLEDGGASTPLHLAAATGRSDIVRLLLEAEADAGARNHSHLTSLDLAADMGHAEVVSMLIDKGSPFTSGTKSGLSPLYLACRKGHLSVVELLMEKGADVSYTNRSNHFNCLDIAIENGHSEVATAIIACPQWKEALRHSVGQQTPLRRMIRRMPDVAHAVLNRCMTDSAEEGNPSSSSSARYQVTLDFEFLEDWRPRVLHFKKKTQESATDFSFSHMQSYVIDNSHSKEKVDGVEMDNLIDPESPSVYKKPDPNDWKPQGFTKVNHPLFLMAKSQQSDLLKHPVVTGLINAKWNNYGRNTFIFNFSTYLFYLIFLTVYALVLPHPDHLYCRRLSVTGNITALPEMNETCPWLNGGATSLGDPTVPLDDGRRFILYIAAILVISMSLARMLWEILVLVRESVASLLQLHKIIDILTNICAIVFVAHFGANCWCVTSWQWQVGSFAVLLSWAGAILFLEHIPLIGIYVLMYISIFKTFLKVAFISLLFVIAFSLSFYMILYKPVLNNGDVTNDPFRNAGFSLVKTMVMTTGEFEYDTIFGHTNDDSNQFPAFPYVGYILWVFFLIAMPILMINLLTALAVDDTQSIQDQAELRTIALQIDLMLGAEGIWAVVPVKLRPALVVAARTIYPNRRLNVWEWLKGKYGGDRWDSVDNLNKFKQPDLSVPEHVKQAAADVVREVHDVKGQMKEIKDEIQELKREVSANDYCSLEGPSVKPLSAATEGGKLPGDLFHSREDFRKEFSDKIASLNAAVEKNTQLLQELLIKKLT